MAKRKSTEKKKENLCPGGRSFNNRKFEHEKGTEINCYRCGALMGCTWCCEIFREIICLACHNWATKKGMEGHGDVVPNRKVPHVRTDIGWRHWTGKGTDFTVEPLIEQILSNAKDKAAP